MVYTEAAHSSNTSVRSDLWRLSMNARALLAVLAVTLWGIVHSHAYDAEISDALAAFSLIIPTPASVVICHGIGCAHRTEIGLGKGDHNKLAALLATGKSSAAAERGALATAIAWFDRRVGPEAGTTKRIARAGVMTERGPGQMDCIDTSRNTTSYFIILDQLRLLRVPPDRGANSSRLYHAPARDRSFARDQERPEVGIRQLDPQVRGKARCEATRRVDGRRLAFDCFGRSQFLVCAARISGARTSSREVSSWLENNFSLAHKQP